MATIHRGGLGFFPPLHWDLSQTRDLFAGHLAVEDPRTEEGARASDPAAKPGVAMAASEAAQILERMGRAEP